MASGGLRGAIASNMKRVMDIFRALDEDQSGEVDRREFHKGIRQTLGNGFSDAELDAVFDAIGRPNPRTNV